MRLILIVLTLLNSAFINDSGKAAVFGSRDQKGPETDRQVIVKELKIIKALIQSNDKNKIAALFDFPIPDSVCNTYIDNAAFETEYEKNDNKISKVMFIKYYKEIASSLRIWDLKNL